MHSFSLDLTPFALLVLLFSPYSTAQPLTALASSPESEIAPPGTQQDVSAGERVSNALNNASNTVGNVTGAAETGVGNVVGSALGAVSNAATSISTLATVIGASVAGSNGGSGRKLLSKWT